MYDALTYDCLRCGRLLRKIWNYYLTAPDDLIMEYFFYYCHNNNQLIIKNTL